MTRHIRDAILQELENAKAEDVVVIDLDGKSDIADSMIVASGRSERQVTAIADRLRKAVKGLSKMPIAVEGLAAGDWVLIDTGDVIVHIFRPEVREFYNLEKMWSVDLPAIQGSD